MPRSNPEKKDDGEEAVDSICNADVGRIVLDREITGMIKGDRNSELLTGLTNVNVP